MAEKPITFINLSQETYGERESGSKRVQRSMIRSHVMRNYRRRQRVEKGAVTEDGNMSII
jgi:hypothetical protein